MADWNKLGFSRSPYEVDALSISEADHTLFFGRMEETAKFKSVIEGRDRGVIAVLGEPGVGKTSFFNYQQNLLLQFSKIQGREIITCVEPCSISIHDGPLVLANRIVRTVLRKLV